MAQSAESPSAGDAGVVPWNGASPKGNLYRVQKFLAHGRSGNVMVAYSGPKATPVVVKAMSKSSVKQEWVDNEVKAGSLLRCKGVVKMRESFQDSTHNYIVQELVKGDDFWQFMQNRNWKPLSEKEARNVFHQLAKSLEYCHEMGVAHKDVKLENIVIDKKWKTTLIDFGFCEFGSVGTLSSRFDGTLDYMAPEMLLRSPFNPFKADVFALGVMLFVLLTGNFPWGFKQRYRILAKGGLPCIDSMLGKHDLSVCAKDLLSKMLQPVPERDVP